MNRGIGAQNKERFFKKGDLILLMILIACVIATAVLASRKGADTVNVYIGGELSYRLSLKTDRELSLLDGKMRIKVEDGRVWVDGSDCSEQICVHSSPLTARGGMIVCLPNRVVIEVISEEVDAIT